MIMGNDEWLRDDVMEFTVDIEEFADLGTERFDVEDVPRLSKGQNEKIIGDCDKS